VIYLNVLSAFSANSDHWLDEMKGNWQENSCWNNLQRFHYWLCGRLNLVSIFLVHKIGNFVIIIGTFVSFGLTDSVPSWTS